MANRPKPYTPEPLLALAALPAFSIAAVLTAASRMDPEPLAGMMIGACLLFILPAILLATLARSWPPLILTAEEADRSLFTKLFWQHLVRAFIIGTVAAPFVMLAVGLLGRPAGLPAPTRLALANYLMAASWALPFLAATGVLLSACGALGARRGARIAMGLAVVGAALIVGMIAMLDIAPLGLAFAAGLTAPGFALILLLAAVRAVLATGHLSYRPFQTASDAVPPTGTAPRGAIIWPSIATGLAFAAMVGVATHSGNAAVVTTGTILGPFFTLSLMASGLALRRSAAPGPVTRPTTPRARTEPWIWALYAGLTGMALSLIFYSGAFAAALFPTFADEERRMVITAMRLSSILLLLEPVAAGLVGLRPGPAQRVIGVVAVWLIAMPGIAVMVIYLNFNAVAVVLMLIVAKTVTIAILGAAAWVRGRMGQRATMGEPAPQDDDHAPSPPVFRREQIPERETPAQASGPSRTRNSRNIRSKAAR